MSRHGKYVLSVVVAIIVIVIFAFWLSFHLPTGDNPLVPPSRTSHTVSGQFVSISGNTITMLGVHILDGAPSSTELDARHYFTVTVTADTKYVDTVYPQISAANASKLSNQQLNTLLKSYTKAGSLNDLKTSGFSFTVKTADDTISKGSFTAQEIDYSTQTIVKP